MNIEGRGRFCGLLLHVDPPGMEGVGDAGGPCRVVCGAAVGSAVERGVTSVAAVRAGVTAGGGLWPLHWEVAANWPMD